MGTQTYEKIVGSQEFIVVGVLFVIGTVLVALAPAKENAWQAPAAGTAKPWAPD